MARAGFRLFVAIGLCSVAFYAYLAWQLLASLPN